MKLFEVKQPRTTTTTDTRTSSGIEADFFKEPKFNAPANTKPKGVVTQKIATGAQTKAKARGVELPAGAADKLAALHASGLQDEISDKEAAIRAGIDVDQDSSVDATKDVPAHDAVALDLPKTPENLPAIINKQIAKKEPITPEWHMVKHLPGYLQAPIRALGRQVFKAFTDTSIEDINVLANVNKQGPNSEHEINAAAGWIRHHGHEITDANLDFAQSIPGYDADVKVFHALGYAFMLVKDFAGHYIYSWPLSNSLSQDKSAQSRKRLT